MQGRSKASEVAGGGGGGGGGGGRCRRILPEIRSSLFKIYMKCNTSNRAFCD